MTSRSRAAAALVAVLVVVAACGDDEPARSSAGSTATPEKKAADRKQERKRHRRSLRPTEWVVGSGASAYLTFDGTPAPGALDRVMAALEAKDAPATFFLPGRWVKTHPEEVAELLDAGHLVGNRGWGDRAFTNMKRSRLRRSILRAERALLAVGSDPAPFLRPPDGKRDRRSLAVAGRMGYRSVLWSVRPGVRSPRRVADYVAGALRPGSIVSLDLRRKKHVKAVPRALEALKRADVRLRPLEGLKDARAIRWDLEITPGWKGKTVEWIQRRLEAASYPVGSPDGTYGTNTLHAVYAFQKVHGLERDGRLDPAEMEMIATVTTPPAPRGGGTYVDIDLTRQVLFEVVDGTVVNTYPISSASGASYVSDGETRVAVTPTGDFVVERKIPGWRVSDLGELYYPSYFYGGYAIHGSGSVPTYPASHGCIRIPMHVAADFYARNPIGTSVHIHH